MIPGVLHVCNEYILMDIQPSIPALSFVGTNLLQDGVDKHCVFSNQGAHMLADISMRDDSFHSLKHGHTPLHNNFGSLCFCNPALLCFVQNHFQAHSTPRTAFLQEGEDEEDMTPMHTTMIGAWHQERGVQQGCPSHEGGPRLIRFKSPRWRSKETKVGVHLGVPELPAPKLTPRPHTESVLDGLYMDGKIISRSFQWH